MTTKVDYRIRRARPEDGPAVRVFVLETFAAYGIVPDFEGADKDLTEFGEHGDTVDSFVAEVDGKPVGSVMIAPSAANRGWLSKFFVDRAHRGKGIGRTLLACAVEAARARGYRHLDLDTESYFVEAQHLYESTGWKRVNRAPIERCDASYSLEL
ncbi:MAG TPA: GNAT family N-acetyltransferase [Candidatus Eremiobacteraceae bacterium]|nr:GNAT family N-acetyltransferase [Candidatus Eremiobacteraceae bacterium]